MHTMPFPLCDRYDYFYGPEYGQMKHCNCIGIKRHFNIIGADDTWSRCAGIPINHECYVWNRHTDPEIINKTLCSLETENLSYKAKKQ